MIIDEIYIKNSRRHVLAGTKEIIYKPRTSYQMIVGTNGSGKTSLMEEIYPVSSNLRKTYNDGGGKIVRGRHNGKKFVVKSGLELGNKHSFKIDGIELNDGGTVTVQDELVFNHFGINKEIYNFIMGKTSFTDFNTSERKHWLQKIDKLDYTYVLSKYDKYNDELKNIKGALKIAISQIKHNVVLLTDEEVTTYQKTLHKFKDEAYIIERQIERFNNIETNDDVENELMRSNDNILKYLNDCGFADNVNIIDSKNKLKNITIEYEKTKQEIVTLKERIKRCKKIISVETFDTKPLHDNIVGLNEELIGLEKLNPFKIKTPNLYEKLNGFRQFITNIDLKIRRFDNFTDIISTDKNIFKTLRKLLESYEQDIFDSRKRLLKLTAEKEHLKIHMDGKSVTCPKCETKFKDGFDENRLNSVTNDISQITKEINDMENKIKPIIEKLKRYDDFKKLREDIKDTLTNTRYREFLFHSYENIEFDLGDGNHNTLVPELKRVAKLLEEFSRYDSIVRNISKAEDILENHMKSKNILKSLNMETESLETLEDELVKKENKFDVIMNKYEQVRGDVKKLEKLQSLVKLNNTLRSGLYEKAKYKMMMTEIRVLEDVLKNIKCEEERIQSILSINTERTIEKRLSDENIQRLTNDKARYELLVSALSHNKGIIGDAIMNFMSTFIKKVNAIIDTMWTYKLEVQPCGFDKNGRMKYLFPVHIKGIPTLNDISEGSSSMREMFNLAFRLVSMDYLDMSTYPIFLDEFGSKMDTGHREKAFNMLKTIKGKHSQVFMISHFIDFYGGIANMDISVLSTKNINMDNINEYNKVMLLKG